MPKSHGRDWAGAPEAAAYLGIMQRTLYCMIDRGQLPAYKVGRVIRLRWVDIETFIESCRIGRASCTTPTRTTSRITSAGVVVDSHDRRSDAAFPVSSPPLVNHPSGTGRMDPDFVPGEPTAACATGVSDA